MASHRGGLSFVLEGHCLLGRSRGLNWRYFFHGSLSLRFVSLCFCLDESSVHGHLEYVGHVGKYMVWYSAVEVAR